ncbi:uncharacterized protein LOC114454832 isoform X2 [Gouania willdenowi]|nr:uncharacterized protein LOC114454832 isoform X2 [Gouania willdenowi]XP_028291427.1 uncharacterized protein LOC114454832 isoform X2 [Gouania willdenowi]
MDVSIAVSLLRGQMGAVVERAVSGAVETVLSEMLRAVGVKFEELKAELLKAKREAALLQREKVQREKESDAVRAKLRYAELKLKYYRQGVEEELQHRAALAHSHLTGALRTPTAPQCTSSHRGDGELTVSDWERSERRSGQTLCDWTMEPPQVQDQQSEEDSTNHIDSSTLPPAARQVKQEVHSAEGEELMCVKEEPQEVKLPLLPPAETLSWATPPSNLSNHSAVGRLAAQNSSSPLGSPLPRPVVRHWNKDLRLYEELKMRRWNLNRRRELQETLSQPLLTELVRERREKTRLRVARWRAKRKLQAQVGQIHQSQPTSFFTDSSPFLLQAEGGAVPRAEFHVSASCDLQRQNFFLNLGPSPSSAPPQPSVSWSDQ